MTQRTPRASEPVPAPVEVKPRAPRPVPPVRPDQEEPSVIGYLAALWRRWILVTASAGLGLLLLGLAVPAMTSRSRTVQASVRMQVAGTPAPAAGARSSGRTTSRFSDVTAMGAALRTVGKSAADLTAVQGHAKETWPSAVLRALSAQPVAGTTITTLSYADAHRDAATTLLSAYAKAWTSAYNTRVTNESKRQVGAFQEQADRLGVQVQVLALQADSERLTSPGRAVSTKTSTDLRLATSRYEAALLQLDRVRSSEISRGTPAIVAGPVTSSVVGRPTGRATLLGAGLLLGLLVGVGLALLAEGFRSKVVTAEEVETATGLNVLATVSTRGRARSGVTVSAQPYSPAAEGFQRARAVLQLQGVGESVRTLAVLGAESGAGKSTLVANLATSLANLGSPVVVVSADLRQPRLDRLFGVEGRQGLSNLLDHDLDPSGMIVRVTNELSVLPAGTGTGNPAELLGRSTFGRLLSRLAPIGAVLIDTPPALWSGEAMAVAAAADASIIVARAGHSSRAALRTLALDLRHNGLDCLGVVLVGVKRQPGNPRPSHYAPTPASRVEKWLYARSHRPTDAGLLEEELVDDRNS